MSVQPHQSHLEKFSYGVASGALANIVAIPLSAVFTEIAKDIPMNQSLLSHYKMMTRDLFVNRDFQRLYRGGLARMMQKIFPAAGNALLPEQLTEEHPLLSRAALGVVTAIPANFFKILQTNKVLFGTAYPGKAHWLAFHPDGRALYRQNSLAMMINEPLRLVALFGISDLLRRQFQIDKANSIGAKIMICAAASVGSAVVESTVAFPLETYQVVHGAEKPETSHRNEKTSISNIVKFCREKKMFDRKYLTRCFVGVLKKNFWANFVLVSGDQIRKEFKKAP